VQAHDDGFHEIQLNGKQLVFLFMAATVVSVVIFLCGVLVGRGVRAERAAEAEALSANPVPTSEALPAPATPPAGSDPTTAAAPPAVTDLSYFSRLEKSGPPVEDLKPATREAATSKSIPRAPDVSRTTAPQVSELKQGQRLPAAEAGSVITSPAAEPAGSGFALQVTALRDRAEADAIARRLTAKGYSAYVVTPAAGAPSVYRVRVGKFPTRREAEAVASKLQKEEQFTPWITR
jgi:DedD protein